MFNNQIIAGSSGQGGGSFYSYTIDQSLRFNDNDSAKLSRTPSSDGNRQTFTISFWMKRANIGAYMRILNSNVGSDGVFDLYFDITDEIVFRSRSRNVNGAAFDWSRKSVRKFRDTGSWYHIVIAVDVTVSSPTSQLDLFTFYVNGEDITSNFTNVVNSERTATSSQVNQYWNSGGTQHDISSSGSSNYFDGYLAEFYNIDGTALDPTSFGETSNGIWVPKEVTGLTFGTNGFYLSFADSAAIGDDLSGNTNDFTATNLAASDVVSDSPTNSFCTLNPLTHGTYPTLKEGNLSIATVYSADLSGVASTWYPTTGKWYWEVHNENAASTYPYLGITDQRYTNWNATKGTYFGVAWLRTGTSASSTNYMGTITKNNVTSWTNNDIIMFALDVDNRKLWVGKNGTWDGSGDPAAGTGEDASWTNDTGVSPMLMGYSGQGVDCVFNFGQDGTFVGNQTAQGNADENGIGDFYYSPPSGFLAMATSNIDDGNIGPNSVTTSDQNFNIALYQSNGGLNTITGLGHQPDFLWIKQRDSTNSHAFTDSVRGPTKALSSNLTDSEYTYSNGLQSFDSDGFTLNGNNGWYNSTTVRNYVAWSWKAGGTAVSNTDGSITSSVSANQDAGFSIVSYTGTGSAATVGHGLASAPEMVIVKERGGTGNWFIYHKDAQTSGAYVIYLNLTNSAAASTAIWNNTQPTNTVFSLGTGNTNTNTDTYIAYCFHSSDVCKVGKYYGNGNANGPFVYTGFRPAFVLLKVSSAANNWFIYDNKREGYNQDNDTLSPNLTSVEDTTYKLDLISNGFKIRGSQNAHNQSGQTFIYLAFAEAPFKYSNAR